MKYLIAAIILLTSAPVHADTVVYAGVQYDTDRSAAQCQLSTQSGDMHMTGNAGIRHNLFTSGRWSLALKAEHISCIAGRDMNDTNSVGAQFEFQLFR